MEKLTKQELKVAQEFIDGMRDKMCFITEMMEKGYDPEICDLGSHIDDMDDFMSDLYSKL
jgi:hypothetical protein